MPTRYHATLITAAAAAAFTLAGCSSTNTATPQPALTNTNGAKASMIASDDIGAAIFADDTALAGDFRPYAGRLDGPTHAAFATQANESTYAGVETD